jgi:hypothetical protein
VEDIGLVASALYDTYLSIEEQEPPSGLFIHDKKLESLKIEIEELQNRVRMGSKEIRKLSDQQDCIQSKIEQLGVDKARAKIVVNKRKYVPLQLDLDAKQSARVDQTVYQDAQDQVRLSKDRVRLLDEELAMAEEVAEDLAAKLEEVEEENAEDMRSLFILKKTVENRERSVATGQVSAESSERMKELQETAVKQRRALWILHDRLIKLTYEKSMETIDAEEKQWLKMLSKF